MSHREKARIAIASEASDTMTSPMTTTWGRIIFPILVSHPDRLHHPIQVNHKLNTLSKIELKIFKYKNPNSHDLFVTPTLIIFFFAQNFLWEPPSGERCARVRSCTIAVPYAACKIPSATGSQRGQREGGGGVVFESERGETQREHPRSPIGAQSIDTRGGHVPSAVSAGPQLARRCIGTQ